MDLLISGLRTANTPPEIIQTLTHGFQCWPVPSTKFCAMTSGRIGVAATILATAGYEQFYSIGWYQMLLGRISLKWENAFRLYTTTTVALCSSSWTTTLVQLL
jgi:hypothetical protein